MDIVDLAALGAALPPPGQAPANDRDAVWRAPISEPADDTRAIG